ncbi:hypothetical protein M2302_002919, partial [Micromonospora sp. A200]|nr:hypothetical protein [Micromonospora sp. A200]
AHFGPLRTFVIAGSDHPNHTVLARGLHAYLRAGATPTPATPTSWPPNAATAPASAVNDTAAGANPPAEPHNQPGQRLWSEH